MTRRTLLAAAATGVFAADRRNRAPVSKENLVVKIPEAVPVKLSNGATLLTLEDNRLPLAYVRFQIESAGPIYSSRPGIAELTADMLREGAAGLSGKQVVEEAARLGATFNTAAAAGAETAVVDGSGLASRFDSWLALLCGVLLRPTFPADEFNGMIQRRVVNLRIRAAQSSALVEDTLPRLIFGSHPAAINAPPAEALVGMTPEMLAAWHRERYTPAGTIISCIGRVKTSSVAARAESLLGAWKTPAVNVQLPPTPQPAAARRIVLIDRPGAVQTELAIGGLLMERRDPDYFPMSVLNQILGGSLSSRLPVILRDEKGYAYRADSMFGTYRFPGFWRVRAGVRTDSTADSIAIILAQLQRLCDEPVPAAELDEARRSVVGRFALQLDQPLQIIGLSALRHRYGFSVDYWERYPAKMTAVTASEIQAVAQKYLNPTRAHIVALGDAARIRPALAKLGPIEA